jgi:hypothetical protein
MKHKPNLFTEENMKLSSEARDKLVSEWYEKWTQELINAGYDGVINKLHWKINEVVVFDSKQIKSATNNNWAFDKNNPDIFK